MKVQVVRSYWSNGSPTKVGDVLEIEDRAARGLIASGKVERVSAEPAPVGPMTTENTEGLVTGKKRREKQDAAG